ncbi:MAG: hypothetical protein DCC73_01810 [Proteobacteria bacterium]|nr:MAG: hypothetical protein DCC73_01810 [Pseudomonadota bacterium]
MNRLKVIFEIGDGGQTRHTVTGRDAWALLELHRVGETGCTPIDNPGPRWSAYVFNLRKLGVAIATVNESHKGPFPGSHARYVLQSPIRIVSVTGGERAAA